MYKRILVCLTLLFIFSLPVDSKSNDLKFVIVYDSNEENMIQKKNEIVVLINETLKNIDEKSYYDFLKCSKDELENSDRKVSFEWGTLYFYLGDRKGVEIQGNILNNSFCMVDVKPKSLIKQWLKF